MDEVKNELLERAEPGYAAFQGRMIPGAGQILGVRIPALRAMAKRIAKRDADAFLREAGESSMEETMLQGLVLGYAAFPLEERLARLAHFIPKIDNWAVCDCCASTYTFMKRARERVWDWLQPYHHSAQPYACRFALVCEMDHFLDGAYTDRVLEALEDYGSHDYYADMAAAWSLSVCWLHARERALALLEKGALCPSAHNMAIRKLIESRRVTPEDKALVRTLRREGN